MRNLPVVSIALALLVVAAWPAAAADGTHWTCRASAARATTAVPTTTEPVRANAAGSPCTSQGASVLEATTAGPATADAAGAFTASSVSSGASAIASASHPKVALPGLALEATAVEATASAGCNGTAPVVSGTSRVAGLVINGNPVTVPPGDASMTIPLGPAGTVVLNEEVKDPSGTVTRRAIHVTTPAGEVVLAEAIAGAGPAACTSTAAAPPVCPDGATYDAQRNVCVIRETVNSGGNTNTNTTTVAPPYQGPTGGTLMTLAEARAQFPTARCLKVKGPAYVIVGTNGRDNITGTNKRDRILLRGGRDNAEGGRGNDCIDGGKGSDTLSGALGKDRLYGKKGNDHLIGGSHADRLVAGPGKDTINSGFGKDRVFGGKGKDRINIATAGPAAKKIRCGSGRDKIRVNRNEKRRAKKRKASCNKVYVVR